MRRFSLLVVLCGCNSLLGIEETSVGDAGLPDAPPADAPLPDAPLPDAAPPDAAPTDAAPADAAPPDAAWLGTMVQHLPTSFDTVNQGFSFPIVQPRASSFLVYQIASSAAVPSGGSIHCALTAALGGTCARSNGGVTATGSLFGVTVPGSSVQRSTVPCVGAIRTIPITAVDPATTFLLVSGHRIGNIYTIDDGQTVELIDGSTVQLRQQSSNCPTLWESTVEVVSLPGTRVTRGVVASPAFPHTVPISPAVDLSRSLLLYSYSLLNTGGGPTCAIAVRGTLDASSATFTTGCAATATDLSYEVVELPTGTTVETKMVVLAAGELTTTVALDHSFDLGRSFALTGGGFTGGQSIGSTTSTGSVLGAAQAVLNFATSSSLDVARLDSSGVATFTVFVVELPH